MDRNLVIIAAAFAISAAVLLLGLGGFFDAPILTSAITPLWAAAATILAFLNVRPGDSSERNTVWYLITWAFAIWLGGELAWSVYEVLLGEAVPAFTLADVLWLLGYVPAVASMLFLVREFGRGAKPLIHRAIGMSLFAFIALVWIFLGFPSVQAGPVTPDVVLSLAYILADVVLLSVALALTRGFSEIFAFEELSQSWSILAIGLVVFTLSDLAYYWSSYQGLYFTVDGGFVTGPLIDVVYLSAYAFVAAGLWLHKKAAG